MEWIEEVQGRLKRKNQVLFSREMALLQDLDMLLRAQDRITVALWAFDLAEESVKLLEEAYPGEEQPRRTLETAKLWARGAVKMPVAKREILGCHGLAKTLTDPAAVALCHAIGQACSVVHTAGHAMGYPVYELTAIVRRCGIDNCREAVEKRKEAYVQKLFYWKSNGHEGPWAEFLTR